MFGQLAKTIRATVNGSLFVGLIQAILAGIMYALLGVPAAVIWAAVTFLAALIPMFGTMLVWAPVALYLALTGSLVKALILIAWSALVVGTIDNLLYPFLVGDQMQVHTVPTFFSILGGISVFGGAGLILGPLTLAITLGLLDVWWRRTADGKDATHVENRKQTTTAPSAALRQE
jgi:predicted PurR-regulated permease PerM